MRPIQTTPPAAQTERRVDKPSQQATAVTSSAVEAGKQAAPPQQARPAQDDEQVTQALKSINELLKTRSPDLEFSIDRDSDRAIVKVVDKETQEVIRQMPSEDALQIAKALDRLQSMLIRETA